MRAGRTLLSAGITGLAMAVVVAGMRFAPAAYADDPPAGVVLITSPAIVGGTGTEVPFTVIQPEVGSSVVIDNPGTTASVTPQCVPLQQTAGVVACLGSPDTQFVSGETRPGTIPIVAAQENEGLPGESMDWVVEEAVSAVAAVHGVPADDMVRTYARPQIRSYVAMRLLNILNKKLYGVAMTPQETAVYDVLQATAKERLVTASKNALTEYDKYTGNPCGYTPPAPPVGSGLAAIPNPIHEGTTCAPGANQLFKFSDNTPPVATFDKWASYRHPTPSVTQAVDPVYKSMTTQTLAGLAAFAGIGLAIGTSVAVGLIGAATLSAGAVAAISGVIGVGVTGILPSIVGPPTLLAGTTGVVAAAAAGAVAVVLVAIIIAAVAIWQFVEEQAIGTSIRERVTSAAASNDPLGIESRMADYAGLDIDTQQEPTGQPVARIHESDYPGTIVAQVNEWMMFSDAGDFLPDPVTGYDVTESEDSDWHFVVNANPVDFVTVLAPPGTLNRNGAAVDSYRVFFSRGWLMVSERVGGVFGAPVPRLSLNYIGSDGTPGQMSVLAHAEEGEEPENSFQLQTASGTGVLNAELVDSWTYKGAGNVDTTATLVPNQPLTPPLNVIPTVQGELVADNLIELAAHVSDGADAGTYDWTVSRLDDNGNVVETISEPGPNLVKYQTRLPNAGRYRAQVSYTTASETVSGTVEFELQAPEPRVLVAQIEDDRVLNGSLHLDLQLEQNSNTEQFDVTVEWADDARGNTVSKTYTVDCADAGFDVCGTGPMILPEEAPTNANWSESPTFKIPNDQNFLPFVTVTITNGYGAEIKRVFPIEGEHRPRYDTMTPYAALPAGGFSEVPLVEVFPSPLLVESQELTIQPYFGTIAAQLPEGVTVDLEKIGPEWWLTVSGAPQADAIGEYIFYVPFEQEPLGSGLAPPPALATLEIKAAIDPGYRAILRNTPTAFLDRQYRNFYPNYRVEVAQVLGDGVTDFSDFTGTVKCKLVAGPTGIFDKPCTPGQTFPWPAERYSDTLTASVYLESATQPLSDDGAYEVMLGTRFVDPVVTVAAADANALTTTASLVVWDPGIIPKPYSAQGYTVTCSRDGGAFAPCLDSGPLTLLRTPGSHTLDVRVRAPDTATTTQRTTWGVGTPAKRLSVAKFLNGKMAGAKVTVKARGLLPQEKVVIKIAGIRVFKGKANNLGKVKKVVKVPNKLKPGKVKVLVVGATPARKGTRTLKIVG